MPPPPIARKTTTTTTTTLGRRRRRPNEQPSRGKKPPPPLAPPLLALVVLVVALAPVAVVVADRVASPWTSFGPGRRALDDVRSRISPRGGITTESSVVVVARQRGQTAISPSSSPDNGGGGGVDRPPSPFEYVPVTALDDYGRSTQLRHAVESATRHGTTVLACVCRRGGDVARDDDDLDDGEEDRHDDDDDAVEDAIVVCSLQRPRPGIIAARPPTGPGASFPPSVRGMVRTLATDDDVDLDLDDDDGDDDTGSKMTATTSSSSSSSSSPSHALRVAIVVAGVRPDADYLSDRLRAHLNRHWFRYDSLPPTSTTRGGGALVKMAGDVLLDCLGYDRADEVGGGRASGGIGSAAPGGGGDDGDGDDGDGEQRAGRPLGVCAFLLELDDGASLSPSLSSSSPSRGRGRWRRRPSFLTVIEANGVSQRYVAHAMGMGSEVANEELSRRWRRRMSRGEAVDMMRDIMRGIAKARGWLSEEEVDGEGVCYGGGGGEFTVVCETVTSRGIDVQLITL